MRALQYFDSFRGGDARPWLLAIVRTTCFTWLDAQPSGRGARRVRRGAGHRRAPGMRRRRSTPRRRRSPTRPATDVNEAIMALPLAYREVAGPARAGGAVVQADRGDRRRADRHRDVAPLAGARAAAPVAAVARPRAPCHRSAAMNCHDTLGHLNAFLDNEVAPKESLAIEQHLQRMSRRAPPNSHASARGAKGFARRPTITRRRSRFVGACRRRRHRRRLAAPAARPRRTLSLSWLQLGGALAAVAVAHVDQHGLDAAPAGRSSWPPTRWSRPTSRRRSSHRLTDVESSDQHTVKPWLSSRLDYSPPVRDLRGGRLPARRRTHRAHSRSRSSRRSSTATAIT